MANAVAVLLVVALALMQQAGVISGRSWPPAANVTGFTRASSQEAVQQRPFSVVNLESHEQLSNGKVIDCVRLHLHEDTSPSLTVEEAESGFPKAGSGWRKPSRAARALFEAEVPNGCSAHPGSMAVQRGDIFEDIRTPSSLMHCYAIYGSIGDGFFSGCAASLSINTPNVEGGEVSIAQIWVVKNRGDDENYSTLEAGWMVYPEVFEDGDPRLFIYWTNDNYQETGCFNLLCSGFIQTDQTWTLGEKFPGGASIPGDSNNQQYVNFLIYKDPNDQVWCLQLNDKVVGYWDPNVVNFGNNNADEVQFGGEVQISALNSGTQMGSGYYPQDGYPWAASIGALRYFHDSLDNNYFATNELGRIATNADYFGIGDPILDTEQDVYGFYYGGYQSE